MKKGPQFNTEQHNFTTRDNLGIEAAATSLQADLCPLVTTVTPRAFYWPFLVWNHYNYITSKQNWKWDEFNVEWVKRNDYFFVLSNLIAGNSDTAGLAGQQRATDDYSFNQKGPYAYSKDYLSARLGGMQYYYAGCITMGFLTETTQEGDRFIFPRLTEEMGKPLAEAFQRAIERTVYFQKYRKVNLSVPKSVLEEFGKTLSLSMVGMDECKRLLRDAMFRPVRNQRFSNANLISSSEYVRFLYNNYGYKNPTTDQMRQALYDFFSPRGQYRFPYPDSISEIIRGWEVVIGRQYLTFGIELIWKSMLECLVSPLSLKEWFAKCISYSSRRYDWDAPLEVLIAESNLSYEERSKLTSYQSSENKGYAIENALYLILSVYLRFREREDIKQEYLEAGEGLSLSHVIEVIEQFEHKPIFEFVEYVMGQWIVEQHLNTAYGKMLLDRDGYYIERINGKYYSTGHSASPNWQGIRLIQLLQVMKDLDMLEACNE